MTIRITKNKKQFAKHSSSRTKKNCYKYDVNNKSTYEELFNAFECCLEEQDWEAAHITEDAILKKFINEILNNKYKTQQEIITQARLIKQKVLSKSYKKWYA
jgi:hypothetical protein